MSRNGVTYAAARASATTVAPLGRAPAPVMAVSAPRIRYSYLLQWAIVGCCLGTLILMLVYWLGGGRS